MNLRHILLFAVLVLSLFSLFGSCSIEPEQYEIEATRREPSNCTLSDGIKIEHGVQFVGYKDSAVPSGQTCSSKIQTCKDGKISGDYLYSSCNVAASNACILDGKIIESGNSTIAFSNQTIQYSGQCSTISEIRNCNNGSLSGSYPYTSCTPLNASSCYFDGIDFDQTVSNGGSIIAYSTNSAPYLSQCSTYSESRTCNNGSLSGSYQYSGCSVGGPSSCTLNGLTTNDNTSATFYLNSISELPTRCQSEQRYCRNGIFETGSYLEKSCTEICTWPNGGFDKGTNGSSTVDNWTIGNSQVRLGSTTIAGLATPSDPISITNRRGSVSSDQNVTSLSMTTQLSSTTNSGSGLSLRMYSSGTSQQGCDIVRGPYVYSNSSADLDVGDNVSFEWQAQGGGDAYDVFGYIINPSDNYTEIILNATGGQPGQSLFASWNTITHTITKKGNYKFVFVSGTYDATCGRAVGAQLYIDNVTISIADNSTSTLCK